MFFLMNFMSFFLFLLLSLLYSFLYCVWLFLATFPIVLQLYVRTPPPPQHVACYHPPLPHSPRPTSRNYQRVVTSDHPPAATPFLLKKKYLSPTPRRRMLTPPSPTAPARQVAYTDVLSQAAVPPQAHPSCWKKIYKKTAKPIIFHPRAGGPEGIRASDLKAPYQNCLVVQRPAKRLFVPPYLPPRAGFSPPYVSTPPPPHPL